ncbi:hypothetical protein [Paraburkholderia flava]|uniref:hypothetical protein n=1 Tax=Paraburkholderia flava TaxID=2547393 RepID=UPI001F0FE7AE|nr:hypothetical protein [Paraburkholderia flava]
MRIVDPVRTRVVHVDPALACCDETVLRRRRHEVMYGLVQCVAGFARVKVGCEYLERSIGKNLCATTILAAGQPVVVATVSELEAPPEIEQIDGVCRCVLRPEHAHRQQPFAADQIVTRQKPAHLRALKFDAEIARAVSDVLCLHRRFDLAKQRRKPIERIENAQRATRGKRKKRRTLHRSRDG